MISYAPSSTRFVVPVSPSQTIPLLLGRESRRLTLPSRKRGHWASARGLASPPRRARPRAGLMKVRDRRTLVARRREVVGAPHVLPRPEDLVVYEQDAF